ncbi:hypothetical protein DQ04_08161020 [Trypanosoma grayi]|uniref:hypothetical protein n=1 Tax=Trypanosoma grayi TaxID=71804 RepID=UPI0004F44BDE|nr:hypothetical protein DQ04_08161020 [Trypanosoma grayi]KEG08039.1 hypothetical protein DQ04_08161020 [Trypanosoma grayi]
MKGLELNPVSGLMVLEHDRAGLRLAWVAASLWGAIALLPKENFVPHLKATKALIVDWGAPPKVFKIDPYREAIYAVISEEDANNARTLIISMVERETLTNLTTRGMENIFRSFGMMVH